MAYVLWQRYLRHNPRDPHWPDRDRFVLSAGHGCMLLYSLLHLTGLRPDARRPEGVPPVGQPDARATPSSHLTPGRRSHDRPARPGHGQRRRHGDRRALARRPLTTARATRSSTTGRSALVGDGDLMEGISSEAGSLAGHLKLGKLDLPLRRQPRLARRADVAGLHRGRPAPLRGVRLAGPARRERQHRPRRDRRARSGRPSSQQERPTIIAVRTTIGYGSPHKAGTSAAHGSPLGRRGGRADEEGPRLGVDRAVLRARRGAEAASGARSSGASRPRPSGSAASRPTRRPIPELADEWRTAAKGRAARGLGRGAAELEGRRVAGHARRLRARPSTRSRKKVPWLVGGDADLSESTKTKIEGAADFDGRTGDGNNIHYGVREHAMAAHRATGWRTTAACGPSWRPSSASRTTCGRRCAWRRSTTCSTIFVWTHDSIGLGEDGPTHQAVEHLMSLRAMPHFAVIRPGDAQRDRRSLARHHRAPRGRGRPRALPPEHPGPRPLRREGRRLAGRRTCSPRPRAASRRSS